MLAARQPRGRQAVYNLRREQFVNSCEWNKIMKSLRFILAVIVAIIATRFCTFAAERPPNVIFLLADDLGQGDLACYSHPYAKTPHLDQLAKDGTRFEQFCVTGITCCPSRTGFMTSKFPATYKGYPANAGFGERVTITDLLKKAGYATGHFGKWHIGPDQKPGTYSIDEISPGEPGGRRSELGRDTLVYSAAIEFIEKHKDKPFYLNVWGHITHNPVNPPQSFSDRFKSLTVNEADFPTYMREKFAIAKARAGDISVGLRNYLGDVFSLDQDVGRLLKRLDELGLRNDTIVVFSSDHGSPSMRPLGEENEVPKKKRKNKPNEPKAGAPDLTLNLMGYNNGLRGGKHGMYEGGVRVPFIIRDAQWKMHFPTRKRAEIELYDVVKDRGETTNVAVQFPDVVQRLKATIEKWNATLPTEYEKTDDKQD